MAVSAPNCAGKTIYFTDASKTTDFTASTWKWYFGMGDSLITNNNNPVPYIYKQAGVFNVKLVLVNAQGCNSDTLTRTVTVNPHPNADFLLPPVCVTDIVNFEAQTTSTSNSNQSDTYLWDFGDQNATIDNPNTSTERNPKHHYSNAQLYNVSMKVSSAEGCDTTITKQLLINGSAPKADFDILSNEAICNNQPIVLKDRSKVKDFGSVNKLEWHFEAPGQSTYKVITTSFTPDSVYIYYPPFSNLADNTICTITLLAYSGSSCVDSISKSITLLPLPRVKFDKLSTMCIDSAPVQFIQGSELTGINGDGGIYYGDGVTAKGLFDPSLAGLGTHTIKYKFTSVAGCADSLTNEIAVIAKPSIEISGKIYLLPGQSVMLRPKYTGNNLSYKWEPATNLDNDTIPYPTIKPLNDITYKVTASNGLCQFSAYFSVFVLKPPVINNTFTPNGDGVNDTWEIPNLSEYQGATVEIFNRYGQSVYYSVGYPKPWDGKYHGADIPVGTYYYFINLQQKGLKPLSGYVTVIR
ncbi:MAG: domain containing protein [Mucilaginibacter sp.]|nr:domain containing protein [Mucilaginibacter sp.]